MSANCLNCDKPIHAGQNWCAGCGQKTTTRRITLHDTWHDLWHAFTHTDRGILFLFRKLFSNPGKVARLYVAGKRKTYFNPFSFLVLMVGLSSFIIISTGFVSFSNQNIRPNPISDFLNTHVNIVIFFNVPILAFFNWLFFKRSGKNFAENLVLAAYSSGARSLFFTLVIAPLWMLVHDYYVVFLIVYSLCWFLYFGWSTKGFYQTGIGGFFKGVLAAILTQLVSMLVVSLVFFIYFRFFYR